MGGCPSLVHVLDLLVSNFKQLALQIRFI
jgi:hypothetical protein